MITLTNKEHSKIAWITDTHQGCRNASKFFRDHNAKYWKNEFFPRIKQEGIEIIIHAGDFFDSRNSLSLQDIDYVVNTWLPMLEDSGATMYIIAGNHDVAYRNTNTINSLSLLKSSENVVVIDNEVELLVPFEDGPKIVMCPWINNENYEDIMEDLKTYASEDNILVLHGSFKGMKMYKGSIPCDQGLDPQDFKKFAYVFSGHFHHPSIYGNIQYIGSMFYFNWQDHGDWRGWMIYDNDKGEFELVENEDDPFASDHYELIKDWTDEQLKEKFGGRISRLTVSSDYDKVELKDFVYRIEQQGPISVDLIDNTIIDRSNVSADDEEGSDEVKELSEYVDDALEGNEKKDDLKALFDEVFEEAKARMAEVE